MAHLIRKYSRDRIRSRVARHAIPERSLARVVGFIHAHLDDRLSLKQLADIAEISQSHFLLLFKRATGTAPHQYVIAQRVEKAKALLMRTGLPIADIAGQTGFADQSHLTRLMRRYTGLTPRTLRAD